MKKYFRKKKLEKYFIFSNFIKIFEDLVLIIFISDIFECSLTRNACFSFKIIIYLEKDICKLFFEQTIYSEAKNNKKQQKKQ